MGSAIARGKRERRQLRCVAPEEAGLALGGEQVVSPQGTVLCSLSPFPARPLCVSSASQAGTEQGGLGLNGALFFQEGNESRFGMKSGVKKGQGGGSRSAFLVLRTVCTYSGGELVLDSVGNVGQRGWAGWEGAAVGAPLPWGCPGGSQELAPCAGLGFVFFQSSTPWPRSPEPEPRPSGTGGSSGLACGSTSASCSELAFDPEREFPAWVPRC